jgi:hypothetical protein
MTKDSIAKRCLEICPLFEAELLLELMMRQWGHPLADNEEFRQVLLESATELLMTASDPTCQEIFIEGLPAQQMNLVSAIWYCEWCGVQDSAEDRSSRQRWLDKVRKSLPSCFCGTDLLN